MTWNAFLALVGLFFVWLLVRERNVRLKLLWVILSFIFVPNSVYVLTDLIHIPEQWGRLFGFGRAVMLAQMYALLLVGVYAFLKSMSMIEGELNFWKNRLKLNWDRIVLFFLVCLNFLFAFGVAMGRIQRTNSWNVLTEPSKVLGDVISTVMSLEMMLFVGLFGIGINCIYFGMSRRK